MTDLIASPAEVASETARDGLSERDRAGMETTMQGFGALLEVYVRQYRAEISAELRNVDTSYRRPDSAVMLDQDIEALAQVYAQADTLLTRNVVCTQRIFTQARMLVVLAEANAGAVQSHLPLVQEADLSYINGPMVSVLNQGRLMTSAKRLQDIDGHFFRNIANTVNQVRTALAIAFPKPLPEPGPHPGPQPGPQPGPRPQRAPEPGDDLNLEPSYEDAGVNEPRKPKRKEVDVEEGEVHAPGVVSALIGTETNAAANTPKVEI